MPVFKYGAWRRKGVCIPERLEEYKKVDAELNVLPFCTQFIPMEVITHPKHHSIIYHPSLLPVHRGASAINWCARVLHSRTCLAMQDAHPRRREPPAPRRRIVRRGHQRIRRRHLV